MTTKTKKARPTGRKPAKATPKATRQAPADPPRPAEPSPPDRLGGLFPWVICLFFAFAHTAAASRVSAYGGDGDTFAVLLIPPIITALALPAARRRGWHRWIVVLLIPFIVVGQFAAPALAIAETWVFHRFWVVENPNNLVATWFAKKFPSSTPKTRP